MTAVLHDLSSLDTAAGLLVLDAPLPVLVHKTNHSWLSPHLCMHVAFQPASVHLRCLSFDGFDLLPMGT